MNKISKEEILLMQLEGKLNSYYDWNKLCQLSEEILEKYQDKFDWCDIICYQQLSENFIEKHIKFYFNDDLDFICIHQNLSETFIENHVNELNKLSWEYISEYQKLSEDFIEKYKNKVNWYLIFKYQHLLSDEFKEKHKWRIKK